MSALCCEYLPILHFAADMHLQGFFFCFLPRLLVTPCLCAQGYMYTHTVAVRGRYMHSLATRPIHRKRARNSRHAARNDKNARNEPFSLRADAASLPYSRGVGFLVENKIETEGGAAALTSRSIATSKMWALELHTEERLGRRTVYIVCI